MPITNLLPNFSIEEETTAPQMRRRRLILDQIDEVIALAEPQINLLIDTGPKNEIPHHYQMQMGTLLAHAMIDNNMRALEAIGLFWVNRSTKRDSILDNLWTTLSQEGRLDLIRPTLKALHSIAFQVWESREKQLESTTRSAAGRTPPKEYFSYLCETVGAGTDDPTGAAGWCHMGHWMAELGLKQASANGVDNSYLVAQVIRDVITTVPDTRAWKTPIFLAAIAQGINSATWDHSNWWREVLPCLDNLNDKEAGLILRRLSDVAVINEKSMKQPDLIAQELIGRYPHISLEDWLLEDMHLLIRTFSLNRVGWSGMRLSIMTENRPFERSDIGVDKKRLPECAQTYDQMISWLGVDRFDKITPLIEIRLIELLQQGPVEDLPVPFLRAAMDRLSLTAAMQKDQHDQANPDERIGSPQEDHENASNSQQKKPRRSRL